jgi:cobaltochelatase CobT
VARNLLAHPGAEDDGVRWLAFETVSGQRAPDVKAALTARVKSALPADLLDRLDSLRDAARDQSAFAAAAAEWIHAARKYVHRDRPAVGADQGVSLPLRYVDKYQRLGRYESPVGTSRVAAKPRERRSGSGDGSAPAGSSVQPSGQHFGYRVFTTAHDRVVNAAALASRDELEQLRRKLDAELSATRSTVARLAKKLLRVLMARQVREWRFDRDEGLLDASRLAPMVASRGVVRPSRKKRSRRFRAPWSRCSSITPVPCAAGRCRSRR